MTPDPPAGARSILLAMDTHDDLRAPGITSKITTWMAIAIPGLIFAGLGLSLAERIVRGSNWTEHYLGYIGLDGVANWLWELTAWAFNW